MNFRSACAYFLVFFTLPYVDNYAGVVKEQKNKKRLEFLAKGKHNFDFNISLGHNFSNVTYDTGLKAKIFSANGEIFLYDPAQNNPLYSLPTLSKPSKIIESTHTVKVNDKNVSIFDTENFHALLDLKDSLKIPYFGSVIPLQIDFNYIFNRFFKIGAAASANIGFYYLFSSPNLKTKLNDYKYDKKTSTPILEDRFKYRYLKRKLSVDYKVFFNLGFKLCDYNPYSLWIYLQNGFSMKMGNKFFANTSLINGYTGNIFLSLEKYLSRNIKMFYNLGGGINVYHNKHAFDNEENKGKNIWQMYDWSVLNFSFGFSFGSNDGRYEDYMYQKAEYDYFIDKYQRMFDFYEEYFPYDNF